MAIPMNMPTSFVKPVSMLPYQTQQQMEQARYNRLGVAPIAPPSSSALWQDTGTEVVVRSPGKPQPVPQQPVPQMQSPSVPYGLSGSELALQAGLLGGSSALQEGQSQAQNILDLATAMGVTQLGQFDPNQVRQAQQQALMNARGQLQQSQAGASSAISGGIGRLDPYAQAGTKAQQLQMALSGALGRDAQQQAYDDFISSPGQEWLRERGQRELLSGAAAIGGLGGGRVREELVRFGQGLASQDLNNQLAQLNALRQGGLQAAGQQGQLSAQQAQMLANMGMTGAQMEQQQGINELNLAGMGMQRNQSIANLLGGMGTQAAGISQQTGRDIANQIFNTGQLLSGGRLGAGQQIAQAIGNTTQGLSNLAQQQGAGLSDLIGSGAVNIANLLGGYGQGASQLTAQQAQILANLATGQGTQLAGLQSQLGQASAASALQQGANQQELLSNLLKAYGAYKGGS